MKELAQVRQAVIDALCGAGMTALEAFPNSRAKAYDGAVAAVAVGAAEGKNLGFCNYLGEIYDEAAGTVRELYGKQLEGDITVDIRAERAADCESGAESAAEVLLGGLPAGIRPRRASVGGPDVGEDHGDVPAAGEPPVPGGLCGGKPGGGRILPGLYLERSHEA